jgi:hypothetical protein
MNNLDNIEIIFVLMNNLDNIGIKCLSSKISLG